MKLNFTAERILAVMAHPDDAELLCAGTLARARADGAVVGLCSLCRGDKGTGRRGQSPGDLSEIRRGEFRAAAEQLGADVFCGGIDDGDLANTPEHRRVLVEIYRRFGPTLVLAHAPTDYHTDHRAASALAEAASWFSASSGHATGEPPLASPPAIWWTDTVERLAFEPGFYVDVTEQMPLKRAMLACHRSQLVRGEDSDFEPLDELMSRQAAARGAQAGVAAAEAFRIHAAWKRLQAW